MAELTGLFKRSPALFSGKYEDYITPKKLFKELDDEFHFVLDPCTTEDNPLGTPYFYTKKEDGLTRVWYFRDGGSVFVNPPYGKEIIKWIEKALRQATYGMTIVMLLPARTDTKWFHEYLYGRYEIRFIRGRLKFEGDYGSNTAPFPSMLAIIR